MKDFLYKITRSSQDPEALALTFKGVIVAILPTLVMLAPIICAVARLCVNPDSIVPFGDFLVQIVEGVASAAAAVMVVYGLFRKLTSGQWAHPDA